MKSRRGRRIRGFTFIEVEISLLLLLVGILALIEISPLFLQGSRITELHAMAQSYAEHYMEREMGQTYDIQSSNVLSQPDTGYMGVGLPGVRANTYEYRISRSYHPTIGADLIVLTVSLRWRDPNVKRYNRFTPDRMITLVSYKGKYP